MYLCPVSTVARVFERRYRPERRTFFGFLKAPSARGRPRANRAFKNPKKCGARADNVAQRRGLGARCGSCSYGSSLWTSCEIDQNAWTTQLGQLRMPGEKAEKALRLCAPLSAAPVRP